MNVADLLADSAREAPSRDAIVWPDGRGGWRRITYADLDAEVDGYARALTDRGLESGEHVLVLAPAGEPLIALTYALFRIGAVPVLIDPGMGRAAFLRCVETTAAATLIGIPKAHVARLLFPRAFRSVRRALALGWAGGGLFGSRLRPAPAGGHEPPPRRDLKPQSPAAVLFTSGSTGPAKGACYTVANFFAQRDALRDLYGFRPGEVDLAAFPLFSLFDAAFGMTSVIPDIDPARPAACRPEAIAAAIAQHGATTAFGSPAIWARVAPWASANGVRFPTLRRVLMAGAPVPPKLVRAVRPLLSEGGDVHTPYGATESLPVSTIAGREVEAALAATEAGAGTCVGRPGPHVEVRVIPISDAAVPFIDDAGRLPAGEVGEIAVFGGVVTASYHRREDATSLAKMHDPRGGVWHRVGDLGYFDDAGSLWFCGRKAERVTASRGTLFTDRVECRFSNDPAFGRVALVGVGPAGDQEPILIIEGPPNDALRRIALERCAGVVRRVLFKERFPVDRRHNAKIHRLELALWAATAG